MCPWRFQTCAYAVIRQNNMEDFPIVHFTFSLLYILHFLILVGVVVDHSLGPL